MQKPTRQKTTHGGPSPGCRYYKISRGGQIWLLLVPCPSTIASLSFYHLLEYNHHHTFLCNYHGNSNLGKIKINQTAICAFSEMTKTICRRKAAPMFLRSSCVISNTSAGLKPPIKCEEFFAVSTQLLRRKAVKHPGELCCFSSAATPQQGWKWEPKLPKPTGIQMSTFLTPGWHRDSTGMLAPWPASSRRKEEAELMRPRDDYAQQIQNLQAGT